MQVEGVVKTENARRYLGQFCKHFAHKLPAEFADDFSAGRVAFFIGACSLIADDEALRMTVTSESEEGLLQLQDVAIRHLVRFAFREELRIVWQ
jgi:hypothetical protein